MLHTCTPHRLSDITIMHDERVGAGCTLSWFLRVSRVKAYAVVKEPTGHGRAMPDNIPRGAEA